MKPKPKLEIAMYLRTCHMAQDVLEFSIISLLLPPKCCDYRCVPPGLSVLLKYMEHHRPFNCQILSLHQKTQRLVVCLCHKPPFLSGKPFDSQYF